MAAHWRGILFTLVFVLFSCIVCVSNIPLVVQRDCKKGTNDATHQYYDISQLKCIDCSQTRLFQTVSSDGLRCVCQTGYKATEDYGGGTIMCEACPTQSASVASLDRRECVFCSEGYLSGENKCKACKPAQIEVERYADGSWYRNSGGQDATTCLDCKGATRPNAGKTKCERCDQLLSVLPSNQDCTCPVTQQSGGVCFKQAADLSLPSGTQVQSLVSSWEEDSTSVSSAFFDHNLLASYAMCKTKYSNLTACQTLGNMCVIIFYTKSTSARQDACTLYENIQGKVEWPANMPWLFYSDKPDRVLDDTTIPTKYAFSTGSGTTQLKLKVAKYSLLGSFLGLDDVVGGTLQMCPDRTSKLNAAYTFGVQYSQQCNIPVRDLWDQSEHPMVFYDMYLEYTSGGQTQLYAVPVLNRQIKGNTDDVRSDWTLTRRFFLVDNESYKPTTSGASQESSKAKYIHYASAITLNIQLQTGTKDGRIYPPYLTISYSEATESDNTTGKSVSVSFEVAYTMDQTSYNDDISVAIGVLCALAIVYGGMRTWAWFKRSGKIAIDFVTLIKFFLFCCGSVSNAFFVVLLGSSFWWIVFYKRQDVVFLVPQTKDQQSGFIAFISIAFALKCVEMLHMFIGQATIDIFLIDWERPRPTILTKDVQKSQEAPVSIWRTYFVANEWNEIQTCRKTNPLLQLFVTIFFLHVVGFEYTTSADPYSRFSVNADDYHSETSRVFRFAVGSGVYLVIALIQWIFHTFIYERFIGDDIREFVDLCSMANISVFVMEDDQFGYYIHGRSVHGRADTDMREMYSQLKREEDDLCGHRGLLPNTEQQTFRMALPKKLRLQYNRVVNTLNAQGANQAARMERGPGKADSFERALEAYAILNRFLSAFIDHSLRDLDYMVKDKLLFESILNVEFEDTSEKGRFYNDDGHAFDAVLFFGNEATLVIFDILVFSIVDLMGQNFVLAACLTYLVNMLLKMVRDVSGKKNLAKKTLVDERFLI